MSPSMQILNHEVVIDKLHTIASELYLQELNG